MTPETFFAIRRLDGEMIWGEFAWMSCDGPDDWTVADEDDSPNVDYEIVRMTVEPLARRKGARSIPCVVCGTEGELEDGSECAKCDGDGYHEPVVEAAPRVDPGVSR